MSFTGREGGPISLAAASAMTKKYRTANGDDRKAHFIGVERIAELLKIKLTPQQLKETSAKGIRVYYGMNEDGEKELVLVAADAEQNDILDLVMDQCVPCPNYCDQNSPLNG